MNEGIQIGRDEGREEREMKKIKEKGRKEERERGKEGRKKEGNQKKGKEGRKNREEERQRGREREGGKRKKNIFQWSKLQIYEYINRYSKETMKSSISDIE